MYITFSKYLVLLIIYLLFYYYDNMKNMLHILYPDTSNKKPLSVNKPKLWLFIYCKVGKFLNVILLKLTFKGIVLRGDFIYSSLRKI